MATQIHPEIRKMYEDIQGRLAALRDVQAKRTKLIETRQTLGSQKNENDLVREELFRLEPGASVYKLIGPALVAQDVSDAKVLVEKRLERINDSIKSIDSSIEACDKQENDETGLIMDIQRKMQERQNQIVAQQKAQ
eukprot:GILI01019964.1.p1 GENE.GILI01019964.1~~GILI01019964.1.p1  ORF type:complete len:152 (-),score=29.89 GILI01019964.1:60-470(-)